jgi:segregation and condensation protein B
MDIEKIKSIIEAILFACGREVSIKELVSALEINEEDIISIIENMKEEYTKNNRGIEIIKINNSYQMCTKKEYYEYVYPILDKRSKPNLSNAALETLAIISYNPGITRAEIESIRGVNSDATLYKLLEYNLIEEAGKLDAPGRPMTYRSTPNFLKMFGYTSLDELPELPRYKMDENQQIVIDDILEEKEQENKQDEKEEEVKTENINQEENKEEGE